ncbi:PGF-CTERM sorting domain-containing protein (plasmid) [Haladaptatus sp. SPP-AMP-3]|uniref:PGF-CTERM sorting domain-containing protein n=1 Tax=Haladaptatus sp. SPP-AMP-3 TaxID=3121295 RepID=UPI003C2B315A
MRFKRMHVLAVVLMICAVPATVSAATAANDVSSAPLAQQTTTTDTMGNGTMDDNMTTTTDSMDDGMSDDQMTTTETMDDGTMDDNMTDGTMTDDNMSDTTTDGGMNDGGESGNSDTSLPGFGIVVALVALVGGALYIARNR